MDATDLSEGDIVIVERRREFPQEGTVERRSVVEEVDGDTVDLGIDGQVDVDAVVERVEKSPSVA